MNVDYSGKTVVVVGGTSGINRGIAESFAKCGAKVAVASRKQQKVDETVQALEGFGAEVYGFAADVRDEEELASGLKAASEALGMFDVVVSGAAGNFPAMAKDMSINAIKTVIEIDLIGTFNVLKASYPFLTKPGASIINISAPQAFVPMVAQSHVCSAKAGVDMVTRTLALEWGHEGIRINSVVPGPIEGTEGLERLVPTAELKELARQSVPLKRLGTPSDVADLCLYLGSDGASYVSGAIIPVDGGFSLAGAPAMNIYLEQMIKSLTKRD